LSGPTWLFASHGICGERQLGELEGVLADPALRGDFVLLALHYGPLTAAGRPPSRLSGIRDGPNLLRKTKRADVVVHGHIHDAFWLRRPRPTVCAGSATDRSRACGYNVYEIDPERRSLSLERRIWDERADRYAPQGGPVRVL
jgi:3',5'-cyclic AMP phosphodiesterase CpdA